MNDASCTQQPDDIIDLVEIVREDFFPDETTDQDPGNGITDDEPVTHEDAPSASEATAILNQFIRMPEDAAETEDTDEAALLPDTDGLTPDAEAFLAQADEEVSPLILSSLPGEKETALLETPAMEAEETAPATPGETPLTLNSPAAAEQPDLTTPDEAGLRIAALEARIADLKEELSALRAQLDSVNMELADSMPVTCLKALESSGFADRLGALEMAELDTRLEKIEEANWNERLAALETAANEASTGESAANAADTFAQIDERLAALEHGPAYPPADELLENLRPAIEKAAALSAAQALREELAKLMERG